MDSLFSQALGVEKRYLVYLPPSYYREPAKRYAVAYFLHGTGGTERDWVDGLSIDVVMDSLVAA
ncbi:MAG TPA: hypothetical protein VII66_04735, partial [Gemmatimonadaceae bacterium]